MLTPPRIIERPRLTQLLDAADARVMMLVAPAGYGKTILAEQWLRDKPHAVYVVPPAARDVAALIAGLAGAASSFIGAYTERITQRLQVAADPEQELPELLPLLNDVFREWPRDAWLRIDDYQHIAGTPAAEAVVEALWRSAGVRIFIGSRRRPSWVSARLLLYGEIFEVGANSLTMTIDEADAVLGSPQSASGLVALADGWPAVIALAAMTEWLAADDHLFEPNLYDYFADEVLAAASPERASQFAMLAVAPWITTAMSESLFGDEAVGVVNDALGLGLATAVSAGCWHLHPLLRHYLLTRFRSSADAHQRDTVGVVVDSLRQERAWDEAFGVIEDFARHDLLDALLCEALPSMVSGGRLTTLRQWRNFAATAAESPSAAVIDSEVAFRQGSHSEAEAFATEALRALELDHPLRPRVLFRAGQAAYFLGREQAALGYLDEAIGSADDPYIDKEARWAAFITALDVDTDRASTYLQAFEQVRDPSIDDAVRLANARLLTAIRCGGIDDALEEVTTTARVAGRARDPMIKTAFWNVYGCALALNGRYTEAIGAAERERDEAARAGLSFVVPHADLLEAVARVGLREIRRAESLVADVTVAAQRRDDRFLLLSADLVRARLRALNRARPQNDWATNGDARSTSPLTYGEYLGILAISRAAAVDEAGALRAIGEIEQLTNHAEVQALVALARAILAIAAHGTDINATRHALSLASRLGQLDSIVIAYRAFPPLLDAGVAAGFSDLLQALLAAANDRKLALTHGLAHDTETSWPRILSAREQQVLELVAQGRTNDEVATALFISPVTVKAHLRHIYEKLGVRNRVEAAAAVATEQPALRA